MPSRSKWPQQRAQSSSLGSMWSQNTSTSVNMMRHLQQEACLEGHNGCVNCLEWNQRGDLLASGSDDRCVILWDPYKGTKRSVVQTGHRGNIFSVKFVPDFSDTVVATCACDCQVRLTDTFTNNNIMSCQECHVSRVKRLAVHPDQPHLIWSASEQGYIMQYDLREAHRCRPVKPRSLLIDLKTTGLCLEAKCLAINPVRDEMLAVGSSDIYTRLFDRRFLPDWSSCTAYFAPGHLGRKCTDSRSYGTTYLAFNQNGTELLANVHADQVYLFNTYEPWEQCKAFKTSLQSLILDREVISVDSTKTKLKPYSKWKELKKHHKPTELPEKYLNFVEEVEKKVQSLTTLTMTEFNRINELISLYENCPRLYQLRAKAFMMRAWRGDFYQAVRDSFCALALKPLDYSSIGQLAFASYYMSDKEYATDLLELIKIIRNHREFECQEDTLHQAKGLLENLLRDSSQQYVEEDSIEEMLSTSTTDLPPELLPFDYFNTGLYDTKKLAELMIKRNRDEVQRCAKAFDYSGRYCGHCNMNTDIKEANFFGDFIVAGSDDGAFYIWDKVTGNIVKAVQGDTQILNCVQPHPNICMLATSGIESTIKLWSPIGKTSRDLKSLEVRCSQNQEFIAADPLEAMIMTLYLDRDN